MESLSEACLFCFLRASRAGLMNSECQSRILAVPVRLFYKAETASYSRPLSSPSSKTDEIPDFVPEKC